MRLRFALPLLALVLFLGYLYMRTPRHLELELSAQQARPVLAQAIYQPGETESADATPLVLFTDYLCPACANLDARGTLANTPHWIVHIPGHEGSALLNAAAVCLGQMGHYAPHKAELYALDVADVEIYLAGLKARYSSLEPCLSAPSTRSQLERELTLSRAVKVRGTPTMGRVAQE